MSEIKSHLLTKFNARSASIAIIGLGYVGLPLAVAFVEAGFTVIGIDVDQNKVKAINGGESYVEDVATTRLAAAVARGALSATTDFGALSTCDAAIICVPTPLSKTRDPDVRYLIAAGESVARYVHPGMLVSLESTTYPGTTEELLRPMLEAGGLRAGADFFLAFSPERIDPGRKDYTVENTPKVVGGLTAGCLEVAVAMYRQAIQTIVPVSSTQTAEMVKLLENTFRAVNIALVNETAIMCDKLGIDVWEVIDAANTKPYGFMKFTPGPGVGGHCIPLDPHYLSWKLKTLNYNARFIQLAGEINSEMPRYWVNKVQDALNDVGKPVRGSKVLVLGVAYKKDIDDVRESPALDIVELLSLKGAAVSYHDPHVPSFRHNGHALKSVTDLALALETADCVVIATDHSMYDWADVTRRAALVIDTRHALP
ncbi:MAG: nucleotide sugar dehydrogenase [Anaerolineae bacterium]|nr:nucleotide sugar dehydrogenase [Anaerolineae bacterium]